MGKTPAQFREIIQKNKLFVKRLKSDQSRILAIILTHYGLSYTKVAEIISEKEKISHEAVRLWYSSAEKLLNL